MPDLRFYEPLGPVSLAELAALTGAVPSDAGQGERQIQGVAPLSRAGAEDAAFLDDRRYRQDLAETAAGAVFVRAADAEAAPAGCAVLIHGRPQAAYGAAAGRLYRARAHEAGHGAIHPEAEIEADVRLAPGVVIGAGARIGAGTHLGPNAVIGPGVAIGRRCRIGANVSIGFALIGDGVSILSGSVIGEAGFGVAVTDAGPVDIPQLGRVILQDRVSLGAGVCIDRGAWDDTVVGENTKIDNLVQIAHNVRIGRGCVLAAQVGIAGSSVVGDGVMFGGGAGIADHVEIGSGARVAAHAGVMRDIPAGERWGGAPAQPLRQFMREVAWLSRNAKGRKDVGDE